MDAQERLSEGRYSLLIAFGTILFVIFSCGEIQGVVADPTLKLSLTKQFLLIFCAPLVVYTPLAFVRYGVTYGTDIILGVCLAYATYWADQTEVYVLVSLPAFAFSFAFTWRGTYLGRQYKQKKTQKPR